MTCTAATQAAERLLQLVGSTLGEEALLRLLLGQTLRRPGVFTDPSGPEVVAAAAAAESGSAAGGANVGMGLSVGVVSTLLARFSPQSYPRVYTPWAEAVGSMETLEEVGWGVAGGSGQGWRLTEGRFAPGTDVTHCLCSSNIR